MNIPLTEDDIKEIFPDALLVNRCISQRKKGNPVVSFEVFPRSLKLVRDPLMTIQPPSGGPRGEISSFTQASRRRLKFAASNAFPELISQFGMTYHNLKPDGKTIKRHLNSFLVALRRRFPGVGYLWILEFQRRGIPHFHLYLTLQHSAEIGETLGRIWNRLVESYDHDHLAFHIHSKNFMPWSMGTGSYLCKYLDKEAQKAVPEGFTGIGRFWGHSRGLVPEPEVIQSKPLNEKYSYSFTDMHTGEVDEFRAVEYITRNLCKHHEKNLRKSKWKSTARRRRTCYTLSNGAIIFDKLVKYIDQNRRY